MAKPHRDLHDHIGQAVRLEGTARDAKQAAILMRDDGQPIFLARVYFWPVELRGKRVTVEGTLRYEPGFTPDAGAGSQPVQHADGEQWWIDDPVYGEAR